MLQWFKNYLISPTHQWWVENVWKPSWTKFLTWFYGLPAVLVAGAQGVAALASDNHIQELLAKIHVPDWVPVTLATVALIHYVASGRK